MPNTCETIRVGARPAIAVDHTGEGPLVVLLHGLGGNRKDWQDNINVFAEHFHVAAVDLRGFGDSEHYEGPYRYEDSNEDLVKVMNHLGYRKAYVVGVQAGARLALDFAINKPAYVEGLVLGSTNSGARSMKPEHHEIVQKTLIEPLQRGMTMGEFLAKNGLGGSLSPNARSGAEKFIIDSKSKADSDILQKILITQTQWDQGDNLDRVKVPTLLLRGADDMLVPLEAMQEIQNAISGSQLEIVPDAGHNMHIEQPEKFNKLAIDFLLGLRG